MQDRPAGEVLDLDPAADSEFTPSFRTYGVARPAQRPHSTALGCRSLIRMRPLVQVQPDPPYRF